MRRVLFVILLLASTSTVVPASAQTMYDEYPIQKLTPPQTPVSGMISCGEYFLTTPLGSNDGLTRIVVFPVLPEDLQEAFRKEMGVGVQPVFHLLPQKYSIIFTDNGTPTAKMSRLGDDIRVTLKMGRWVYMNSPCLQQLGVRIR